jgi:FkbM family methyltransferase
MMSKNLVYFTVFNNPVYVDLLEILMATVKLYSNLENIDFLVFTSENLKGRIDEVSAKLEIPIQIQIFNFTGLHEGLCARMRIFDYCDIDKYDKVLYLDTDIVVQNDISVLFAQDIEEKLYALKEGTIGHEYYGSDFFDFNTIDKNIPGMNSGILLFKPTSTILQLFRDAHQHMSSIFIQNKPMPSCSDQALINYHFVKNGRHQTGFLEKYGLIYANERFSTPPAPPSGPTDIILCHFAAPVGDANGKKARMIKHVTHILNYYKNIQETDSQIPSTLIGKDYVWGDGHIFFGANGSLVTKWSRTGTYEIWNLYIVKASWSGVDHVLIFNEAYTRFISIRISDIMISAHQLIIPQADLLPVEVQTKSKNLLYCCVFYNKDYLKLLELLLISMKFYSSEAFHIVVLTSPEFEESVHQISKTLDHKINIMCLNISTIFEAACARLRIFDYPGITEYKNLLYLDTDIIIKGDLAPLFQIELDERLYGIEQGSIDAPNFGKVFFNAQTDFRITGLNSGTLLFKNCLVMRDLFSRIRGHIAAFTDSSQPAPYALDQPFINYHAIKDGLYDNKALNPYVSLYENADTVENYATSVICHFSFPIGNFAHKYHRMKEFLIGLLNKPSELGNVFKNNLSGKDYMWERSYIRFRDTYLQTLWGNGTYEFITSHIVSANWNGFYHMLKFSDDYSRYVSIRVHPNDLAYHSSKNHILSELKFNYDFIYNGLLDAKSVCFIHSCHLLESGTEKLDMVLDAAISIKGIDAIIINNIGLQLDLTKYISLDPRIQVIQCSDEPMIFELPTLKLISEFSKFNKNSKILYMHTKGISYGKDHAYYLPELDWINYMTYFLCKKSEISLELLDKYDTVGCDYSSRYGIPHYIGNFWWATTKYINTLNTDSLIDRTSAEWWILSAKPNYHSLHQPNRNINSHYNTRYPASEYVNILSNPIDMSSSPKKTIDPSFNMTIIGTNNIRGKVVNYINNDTCIGAMIRNGFYWELWMLKYIQTYYIKDTNIIDLGANIGTTTLLMSEVLSQNCKIYAFEPLYSDILMKNVIDNNLQNCVNVYPYGVGNKCDILKIKNVDLNSKNNFGAVSLIDRLDTGDNHINIPIFPVDYFHFENVSLIKIDVEHMEIDVLEGSYDLIQRCKPTILIETYQLDRFKASSIFKKLVDLRYTLNEIPEGCNDYILSTK